MSFITPLQRCLTKLFLQKTARSSYKLFIKRSSGITIRLVGKRDSKQLKHKKTHLTKAPFLKSMVPNLFHEVLQGQTPVVHFILKPLESLQKRTVNLNRLVSNTIAGLQLTTRRRQKLRSQAKIVWHFI